MKLKEIYLRWIGISVVALMLVFVVKDDQPGTFLEKYLISFVITAFYWNVAFQLFMYFRRRFPYIRQTPKRLALTVASLLAVILLGDAILCHFLNQKPIDLLFTSPWDYFEYTPVTLSISMIVGSIYENVYFFEQWRNTIRVNEALKSQQIRTQFEVLQNQMSPHFLFNSLNALTTLISEDSKLAMAFTEKLSDVYRYILQNREKELVTLREELEFVKAYVFLQEMRYPENLNVDFRIDESFLNLHIAPLTLQMLIENAVKHNIISRSQPLDVEIYIENGKSIVVKNNLQKRNVIEKSTKTGLENIRKRYQYLGFHEIDVIQTAKNYFVAVPLIRLKEDILPAL